MKREFEMYKKVVVPLDGSKLAETALPHLEEIAKGCSIPEIMLISVTEKITGAISSNQVFEKFVPENPAGEPLAHVGTSFGVVYASGKPGAQKIATTMGKMAKTAGDYLCKVADGLGNKGFNVTATVIIGNPAEEIIKYADAECADLIIMASRGKSGFSRWDMGNIADKVIKATSIPVLLVKPSPGFKESKSRRRGVAM
jgi:nucleotide-binding universal stress UspA family protein